MHFKGFLRLSINVRTLRFLGTKLIPPGLNQIKLSCTLSAVINTILYRL